MTPKRRALLATLLATTTTAPANAGCLDWLFGTRATTPYAAGYAPQATITPLGPPTLVGLTYASPGVTAPMTAPGFAPYAAAYTPYSAGYAGSQPSVAAQAPAYGAPAYGAAVPSYGVAVPSAATAAAYSIPYDNRSVLTGRPVVQTSATSYMGNPYATPAILPPAAYGPPIKQTSGFGGLFGGLFGNNYQTSYYGVPTTSYRPVTQVDPTSGALITVQQPCTSLTQQVQRSPYLSLQPAAPAVAPYYAEPVCGGEPSQYAPPAPYVNPPPYVNPSPYPPVSNYSQPSNVSQATALSPYGPQGNGAAPYASPIPSTAPVSPSPYAAAPYPSASAYASPPYSQPLNTQPLTGNPGRSVIGNSSSSTGDSATVPQPQLDANRPAWSSQPLPSASPSYPSPSYPSTSPAPLSSPSTRSELEAPSLPAVPAWPNRLEASSTTNSAGSATMTAGTARDRYSDIPPIPAADDYRAPAWGDLYLKPSTTQVDSGRERKPEPVRPNAALADPRTAAFDNSGQDESWRYASTPTIGTPPLLPATPVARQSTPQSRTLQPSAPREVAPRIEAPRSDAGWFVVEPR